ncbi:MAG: phosphoadenosine phosphosulfate reductase family protein [Pseudomonadota bacterium]
MSVSRPFAQVSRDKVSRDQVSRDQTERTSYEGSYEDSNEKSCEETARERYKAGVESLSGDVFADPDAAAIGSFDTVLDDLASANDQLAKASAEQIVRWVAQQGGPIMLSTSMGSGSAVMLHLIAQHAPSTDVVWVDSGYNTPDTYRFAETIQEELAVKLHVYTPLMTAAYRDAVYGPIPLVDDAERHKVFTEQVKLEPFERAIRELAPRIWLTGIRSEESDYRRGLNILTRDSRVDLKVAPIFHWKEIDVQRYLRCHKLPDNLNYFDPTKVFAGRECGLHTAA